MKFFVDTAEVSEIRSLAEAGLVDGVTTTPSLAAGSSGRAEMPAAKAGAAFVPPSLGRPDDLAAGGMRPIADTVQIYRSCPNLKTDVPGAGAATPSPASIRQLLKHPPTDKGLDACLADWRKTGQSIL